MDAKKIFDDHIDKIVKEAAYVPGLSETERAQNLTRVVEAGSTPAEQEGLLAQLLSNPYVLRALLGAGAGGAGGAGLSYLLGRSPLLGAG